jgi:hypothetical protein
MLDLLSAASVVASRDNPHTMSSPPPGKETKKPTSDPVIIYTVQEFDILCGKDKTYAKHRGNVLYKALIDENAGRYQDASTKQEKMNITKEIVHKLHVQYRSRFIKPHGDHWALINDSLARDKTSHALRFAAQRAQEDAVKLLTLGNTMSGGEGPPAAMPVSFVMGNATNAGVVVRGTGIATANVASRANSSNTTAIVGATSTTNKSNKSATSKASKVKSTTSSATKESQPTQPTQPMIVDVSTASTSARTETSPPPASITSAKPGINAMMPPAAQEKPRTDNIAALYQRQQAILGSVETPRTDSAAATRPSLKREGPITGPANMLTQLRQASPTSETKSDSVVKHEDDEVDEEAKIARQQSEKFDTLRSQDLHEIMAESLSDEWEAVESMTS